MIIKSSRILTHHGEVDGYLHVDNGKIIEILSKDANVKVDYDCLHHRILPGIIDTHNHGTMGYGLMGDAENKEKEVRGYLKGLASQGVTACLPTAEISYFETIAAVSRTQIDGAKPIGIHSEGPYLNRVGEKGINTGYPEISLDYCKEMVLKAEGLLKLVAIAPEIQNAKAAIEFFTSENVRCAFAHSDMGYKDALESFKWGITVTTHTANVMAGIHHRDMGGLGACLLNDSVYNELICDGLHVSNEMIEIMMRIKKDAMDKFLMVSDNVPMAGAAVGKYKLQGLFDVTIDEKGFCLSDTGRLMGSTVPVIKGIRNLVNNLSIPIESVIKMASLNPAKVYGAETKGEIKVGKDADFIIVSDDFDVLRTYSEGRCVYDCKTDSNVFNPEFMLRI